MSSTIAHSVNNSHQKQYRAIEVSNVVRGSGSTIARCDCRIGGLVVRNIQVRAGRGGVYVNFPSFKNEFGRWTRLVDFTSTKLAEFVHAEIQRAVSEALP